MLASLDLAHHRVRHRLRRHLGLATHAATCIAPTGREIGDKKSVREEQSKRRHSAMQRRGCKGKSSSMPKQAGIVWGLRRLRPNAVGD